MTLASPAWLLLLIPWLAVLLYLMLGKPPKAAVPFLWLWRGPEARRKTKPSLSKLPLWIALLMLSALTAILASAGPGIERDPPLAALRSQVGITSASIRSDQLMLRLLNESAHRKIPVTLNWGEGGRTETVQLPEAGEQNYFLDIPGDAQSLTVSVEQQSVRLTRQRTWPRIEARSPLPEPLRRVIHAYTATRPPGDDSAVVAIATDEALLGSSPGVILAEPSSPAAGRAGVTDHPVTANVEWPAVLAGARLAGAPPRGYVPLVAVGGRPAVAVWDQPRRVWAGFDSPALASRVDYVVFWTNVLDFVGQGGDAWQLAPGTVLATPRAGVVQKSMQNVSPVLICASVILLTVGLLGAWRRGQAG